MTTCSIFSARSANIFSACCANIFGARGANIFWVLALSSLAFGCTDSSETANTSPESTPEPAMEHAAKAPIATTEYGKVRGVVEDDILVFKGIRYGADTSTTRFMPPQPPQPWAEVKDALAYGNSTRQSSGSGIELFNSWRSGPRPELSEDCLFLNVWTPAIADGAKRPVMVWLHGGGFSTGSGSSNAYDGVRLAKRGDVVVVTVNHRLNIFAHLYLAEYGEQFADSGNVGILDLVQSLEWVRDNISQFGGDPDNVLIFGESGGGAKVSVLMAMDAAKGLFDRAVVQSGPRLSNQETDTAAAGAAALVAQLGLTRENIEQILTMAPEQIEQAAREVVAAGGSATWSGPVFDHRSFTQQPFEPIAPVQSFDVPLLIGTTRTEMSLLAGARRPELFELTWETLPAAMATGVPNADAAAVIAGYQALQPEIEAPELYFTAITDNGFLRRSIALADRKVEQGGASVYFYLFNWNTPVDDGKWKSPHALEIGFVFDNVAKSISMSGSGEEQQNIADLMAESWIAFARTGDPNNPTTPRWDPYNVTDRPMMVIDESPEMVNHPRGKQLALLGE